MRPPPLPPTSLDASDRALINRLQDGIPICADPYGVIASELGLPESEVIDRIERMRSMGVLTRFGPFINPEAIGGAHCLCAMAVPPDRFDEVTTLVNALTEVAHNHERDHRLNMWFTLACETSADIEKTAERIERQTGLRVLRFPRLEEFAFHLRIQA